MGICGGYQMLGKRIEDPLGVEGPPGTGCDGLGLLDSVTVFEAEKRTVRATGELTGAALGAAGAAVHGYEIHMGRATLGPSASPFAMIVEADGCWTEDGAVSDKLPVFGTHLHGLFDNAGLRRGWLDTLRAAKGLPPLLVNGALPSVADPADRLADMVESHLDVDALAEMIGLVVPPVPGMQVGERP